MQPHNQNYTISNIHSSSSLIKKIDYCIQIMEAKIEEPTEYSYLFTKKYSIFITFFFNNDVIERYFFANHVAKFIIQRVRKK